MTSPIGDAALVSRFTLVADRQDEDGVDDVTDPIGCGRDFEGCHPIAEAVGVVEDPGRLRCAPGVPSACEFPAGRFADAATFGTVLEVGPGVFPSHRLAGGYQSPI